MHYVDLMQVTHMPKSNPFGASPCAKIHSAQALFDLKKWLRCGMIGLEFTTDFVCFPDIEDDSAQRRSHHDQGACSRAEALVS